MHSKRHDRIPIGRHKRYIFPVTSHEHSHGAGINLCGPWSYWMRTEKFSHFKISKDPTGNRIPNLPSCGAVPESTAPPPLPPTHHKSIILYSRNGHLTSWQREWNSTASCQGDTAATAWGLQLASISRQSFVKNGLLWGHFVCGKCSAVLQILENSYTRI